MFKTLGLMIDFGKLFLHRDGNRLFSNLIVIIAWHQHDLRLNSLNSPPSIPY
jgi:hypothetical protein